LRLPGVFDQQSMVVFPDGRLMTVHPDGNAIVESADAGRTWSKPRPIRTSATPVVPIIDRKLDFQGSISGGV